MRKAGFQKNSAASTTAPRLTPTPIAAGRLRPPFGAFAGGSGCPAEEAGVSAAAG
jgi:hypothetical protein